MAATFFVVLEHPQNLRLKLPPAFDDFYINHKLSLGDITLISELDLTWKLTLEWTDGWFYLTDRWKNIVRGLSLSMDCILLFEYHGYQTLKLKFLQAYQNNSIGNSFFTVVHDLSQDYVKVPKAFVAYNYLNIVPSKKIVIQAETGETWEVTMEVSANGEKYYFAHGWRKLVRDLRLQKEMLIVFNLKSMCKYEIVIYTMDGKEVDLRALEYHIPVIKISDDMDVHATGPSSPSIEL